MMKAIILVAGMLDLRRDGNIPVALYSFRLIVEEWAFELLLLLAFLFSDGLLTHQVEPGRGDRILPIALQRRSTRCNPRTAR